MASTGTERRGAFYGAGQDFNGEAFAEPLPGEKRQFRFIVRPENARDLDLQAFARRLVEQMEEDRGRRLVRAAVTLRKRAGKHGAFGPVRDTPTAARRRAWT